MLELYRLASVVRIIFTGLLLFGVIVQAARLFLLLLHREYRTPPPLLFYETFMLVHLILAVLMLTSTLLSSNVIAGYFHGWRWFDPVVVILGLWVMLKQEKAEPLVSSLLLVPTLPFWSFPLIHYCFVLANLGLVFRGIVLLDLEWHRVMASVSRLSVKEAVDRSPDGILYANARGRILVINPTMDRLLYTLGIAFPSAVGLWERLTEVRDSCDLTVRSLEGKLLMRIRNAGSWLFSQQAIMVNHRRYQQLLAVDLTEEDLLTREIESSNLALEAAGQEIAAAIDNIEQWEKEQEILRLKSRVHDQLGQRLSILGRLFESEMGAEEMVEKLKPLLTNLTAAIAEPVDANPRQFLASLRKSFALIGTTIHLEGVLPQQPKVAQVFVQVIQECATNAVRHGSARNLYVKFQENRRAHILAVTNDGTSPTGLIVEGEGLPGMRRKIQDLHGTMEITAGTSFQVLIHVPNTKDDGDD